MSILLSKTALILGYSLVADRFACKHLPFGVPLGIFRLFGLNGLSLMASNCFDCLYEEGATDSKFMMWGNHPFVGDRPFRALLLREFIRYAKSHKKVWFATAGGSVKWYRENYRDAQV